LADNINDVKLAVINNSDYPRSVLRVALKVPGDRVTLLQGKQDDCQAVSQGAARVHAWWGKSFGANRIVVDNMLALTRSV
jgi:hypothetical protein